MATRKKEFKIWYENNKNSVILNDEYGDYKYDMAQYGDGSYLTFRQWMKERFEYLVEQMEI